MTKQQAIKRACIVAKQLAHANGNFWRVADTLDVFGAQLSDGVRFTLEEEERRWRNEANALERELNRLIAVAVQADEPKAPTRLSGVQMLAEVPA